MILKMNNKSKDFYNIMGKFFGSRIVQNETNDRIYDDNSKEWYVYIDNDAPVAFVSIASNVIKNVYSIKDDFLIELLQHITKEVSIKDSIVTKTYSNTYVASGLIVDESAEYKNFIRIRSDVNG
ncbi:MAG: hypothetical protein IJB90_03015 [Clostridia bacterium]|nr:hypothetical protein [Clostridia bacterium]